MKHSDETGFAAADSPLLEGLPGALPGPLPGADEDRLIEVAVERLSTDGYAVCTGLLPLELVGRLRAEQRRREVGDELVTAGVGRGGAGPTGTDPEAGAGHRLRQAQSSWFAVPPSQSSAEADFLAFAERVRLVINRRLMLGLFEFEAQFLLYPMGGFYRRHIDALHGARSRVVSMVAYLNADWTAADGGALAIWAPDREGSAAGEPVVEVMPIAGTVVLMLSEEIPHEARTAQRERRAIAGWYRLNASSTERIDVVR